jgi:peroxiredoxin
MRWVLLLLVSFAFVPSAAADFPILQLREQNGKIVSTELPNDSKAAVFVFLGTECPVNNAYIPRLNELTEKFAKDGVRLVGVNSNEHDTKESISNHAKEYKVAFPILRDENQRLAAALGAQKTPEAIVVDKKGTIRYRGRIDDQFGVGFQRPAPKTNDLIEAVADVLAGKDIAPASKSNAAGCYITRAPKAKSGGDLTYAKDIAPIVQNRCQECHRPGQIGPMPLLTHHDVSSWAAMIKEVVTDKRMPPWHADPRFGHFSNDRSLTTAEREKILTWIDSGCPAGNDADLPPAKKFADGWTIGSPDVVFEMPRAFNVPAKSPASGIAYQYFPVPTNFDEDMWIEAAEAKPGNRAVVHHIIVYIMDGKKKMVGGDGIGKGMLVAYAPGDIGTVYQSGSAKRIPKGAMLVFQMHYTPNGVAQSDRSSVALRFAKKPPELEAVTRGIAQQTFLLKPKTDDQKVNAVSTFKTDVTVWALMPHMHLRGKAFDFDAIYPDGKTVKLLSVPKYDFAWQSAYRFSKPLELPAGTRIKCSAVFDNSENNLSNPDPTKYVYWGEQTWEEMMIGFVDYSVRKSKQPAE